MERVRVKDTEDASQKEGERETSSPEISPSVDVSSTVTSSDFKSIITATGLTTEVSCSPQLESYSFSAPYTQTTPIIIYHLLHSKSM